MKSAAGQTKAISALGLIGLMLSLLAVFLPSGQFEVAMLAAILASVAGFFGELIYPTLTAAVTAVNMSLLIPHDDVVMTERPIQIYWTALEWSLAPAVAMILWVLQSSSGTKSTSIPSRKRATAQTERLDVKARLWRE